jgi:hypothetical protein
VGVPARAAGAGLPERPLGHAAARQVSRGWRVRVCVSCVFVSCLRMCGSVRVVRAATRAPQRGVLCRRRGGPPAAPHTLPAAPSLARDTLTSTHTHAHTHTIVPR